MVPVALAHLQQRHAGIDAGIVDQDVGRSELANSLGHHRLDLGQLGDIGLYQVGAAARGLYLGRDGLGARPVVEPGESHVGSLPGQCRRDRRPDALLGARHERHFPGQFHGKIPFEGPSKG